MILCYVDESGVPQIPGNSSHYVLAGLSIPASYWKKCDVDISQIKNSWDLSGAELHTGWILRPYLEQKLIQNFEKLSFFDRRTEVNKYRNTELLRLQTTKSKRYHQQKKNFRQTDPYVHLTYKERQEFIGEIAEKIGSWEFARLFAECIDKIHFIPAIAHLPLDEQAFEQVVSRFEHYLSIMTAVRGNADMGMIIHDNNQTACRRLTELMSRFHAKGTFWTRITQIIETPLFVDSKLTSMVQVADLCAYSLRRYLENNETWIFQNIFKRADKKDKKVVGVRHFSKSCKCLICSSR